MIETFFCDVKKKDVTIIYSEIDSTTNKDKKKKTILGRKKCLSDTLCNDDDCPLQK